MYKNMKIDLPCKRPMDSWSVFRLPTYSATYVLRNHAASRSSIATHWLLLDLGNMP